MGICKPIDYVILNWGVGLRFGEGGEEVLLRGALIFIPRLGGIGCFGVVVFNLGALAFLEGNAPSSSPFGDSLGKPPDVPNG